MQTIIEGQERIEVQQLAPPPDADTLSPPPSSPPQSANNGASAMSSSSQKSQSRKSLQQELAPPLPTSTNAREPQFSAAGAGLPPVIAYASGLIVGAEGSGAEKTQGGSGSEVPSGSGGREDSGLMSPVAEVGRSGSSGARCADWLQQVRQ